MYGRPTLGDHGTEAQAAISTFQWGAASLDSTVARIGALPSGTHASHTAFIASKLLMSASHTLAPSRYSLLDPTSLSNSSILASTCRVCSATSASGSEPTWPENHAIPL